MIARLAGGAQVGLGIFFSRISGFVRDAVLAAFFGSSRIADIWYLSLRTPNLIQNLLGEGTLSASFVPIYSRLLAEGREREAGRFAGAIFGLVAVAAYGLALVGVLGAPWIVSLLFGRIDGANAETLVTLLRIMMPMTATLTLSAWGLGVLNTHGRFFISYVAPVAWNAAMVAAVLVGAAVTGLGTDQGHHQLVVWVAWGALLGALAQLLVQMPGLLATLRGFRVSLDREIVGVGEALRRFGPAVAGRGVVNLSGFLDGILAALLVEGAVAHLARAQTLFVLPISLFAMSVAASELPAMSRSSLEHDDALRLRICSALERVGFFLVASTAAYLTMGDLFVAALYQRGDFGAVDTLAVGAVLAAYSLGLLASGRSRTLVTALAALGDTASPARFAAVRLVVAVGVGVPLMFPLDGYGTLDIRFGAVGLAVGSAVGAWVEYALLRRVILRRVPGSLPRWRHLLGLIAAASVAGLGALGARAPAELYLRPELSTAWAAPVLALGTASVFGVLYVVVTTRLGVAVPLRSVLRR